MLIRDGSGVIQGSEQAFNSDTGYLSKDAYCSISRRSLGVITDYGQREAIYDLFLLYRTKKRQLWQRDAADRRVISFTTFPLYAHVMPGHSILYNF